MAVSWITALKLIPWGDVVENAPTLLRGAKKLWSKMGPPAAGRAPDPLGALQQETAQLKERLDSAASLISSLAEQNARVVEAVDILRVRTRILLVTCGGLVAAVIALAASVLLR